MSIFTKCLKSYFSVHIIAIIANLLLLIAVVFLFMEAHGEEQYLALLLGIPPLLSFIALRGQGDREERKLKKRIRKAHLRKELSELSKFDADA